jgi:hypothetical protein
MELLVPCASCNSLTKNVDDLSVVESSAVAAAKKGGRRLATTVTTRRPKEVRCIWY